MNTLYALNDSLRYITPLVLLALGAALHAYAPYHRTTVWERLRARQITVDEAERVTRFLRVSTPGLAGIAAVLIVLALVDSLR